MENIIGTFVRNERSLLLAWLAAWMHNVCCFLCDWDIENRKYDYI
jgi:hypothetical protein